MTVFSRHSGFQLLLGAEMSDAMRSLVYAALAIGQENS